MARYVVSDDELRVLRVPADAMLGALPKERAGAQKEPNDTPFALTQAAGHHC